MTGTVLIRENIYLLCVIVILLFVFCMRNQMFVYCMCKQRFVFCVFSMRKQRMILLFVFSMCKQIFVFCVFCLSKYYTFFFVWLKELKFLRVIRNPERKQYRICITYIRAN